MTSLVVGRSGKGWAVLAAVLTLALLSACSHRGTTTRNDSTAPGSLVPAFTHLPRFPRSTPLSPRTAMEGVTLRTFLAHGASPAAVLDFYSQHLPRDWHLRERPQEVGATSIRGAWDRGSERLVVSAAPAPTASDGPDCQYTLSLGPSTAQPISS